MNSVSDLSSSRAPLDFAVVGHRDVREEDAERLRSEVRTFFERFRVSRQDATPIRLVTCLAEGADQLAAEVALELGVQLVVVLPFPEDQYASRFEGSAPGKWESGRILGDYRESAAEWIELPWDGDIDDEEARRRQYTLAGVWLAKKSHAMIALWNGREGRPGGTSEIVALKSRGEPPRILADDPDLDFSWNLTGPVYFIETPRCADPSTRRPEGLAGDGFLHAESPAPHGAGAENRGRRSFEKIVNDTRRLNRALAKLDPKDAERALESMASGTVADPCPSIRRLATLRILVAKLARRSKRALVNLTRAMFGSAAASAICLHLFIELPASESVTSSLEGWPRQVFGDRHEFLFVLFLVFLGLAILCYAVVRIWRIEQRALDYRSLSEALRVQVFWNLAGMERYAADHYLQRQVAELAWTRAALRSWESPPGETSRWFASRPDQIDLLRRVVNGWVAEQARWHASRARESRATYLRHHALGKWILGMGGLVLLVYGVLGAEESLLRHILYVGGGTSALAGGAMVAFVEKLLLAEHSRHYRSLAEVFSHCERRLHSSIETGSLETCRRLLHRLGQEALDENAEWLILHRVREIDVPVG